MGEPPRLKNTRNGWVGAREYLVNTMDEYEAAQLCPLGEPWSAALPTCVCINSETRYIAKKDDASGTGGLTVVHQDFEEPSAGGNLPPPIVGTKFTILSSQTETITIYNGLDALPDPGSPPNPLNWPIANGSGGPKQTGLITAKVYTYIPLFSFPNLTRIIQLTRAKAVSSDALALPVVLGTTATLNFSPGQVQYQGFSHQNMSNAMEIVHELNLAPDFKYRWRSEDEDGNASGPMRENIIYEAMPISGLW